MNTESAIEVLEECERNLRRVLGETGAAGDYESVRRIMDWAERVAALAVGGRREQAMAAKRAERVAAGAAEAARAGGTGGPAMASPAFCGGAAEKVRIAQRDYPIFERRGEELVKIGWSKTEKKEYQHRIAKLGVDALVAALERAGAASGGGANFRSEDLNPVKDLADGGVIPSYQIFAALAWIRKLGLVKQHGRKGGYTLVEGREMREVVERAWGELPVWRG